MEQKEQQMTNARQLPASLSILQIEPKTVVVCLDYEQIYLPLSQLLLLLKTPLIIITIISVVVLLLVNKMDVTVSFRTCNHLF